MMLEENRRNNKVLTMLPNLNISSHMIYHVYPISTLIVQAVMSSFWILRKNLLKIDFLVSWDNIYTKVLNIHWWHFFQQFFSVKLNYHEINNDLIHISNKACNIILSTVTA